MLCTLAALEGMSIHALDGPIGTVKDTYFERYLQRFDRKDHRRLVEGRQ